MRAQAFLGPMCIGTIFNVFLLGFTYVQTHRFFTERRTDPRWIKLMVAGVCVMDTVNTSWNLQYFYYFTVQSFGNTSAVIAGTWGFNSGPITISIISGTVQFFFGWRVQRFTGWKWVGIVIWVLAAISTLAGIGMGIGCAILPGIDSGGLLINVLCVWMVSSAITDIIITVSLVLYLQNRRPDTWNKATDDLISRVIALSLRTCAAVTFCSLMMICLFAAAKTRPINGNLYLLCLTPFGKLYSNSLLCSLNSRILPAQNNAPTPLSISDMVFDISPEGGHSSAHISHKIRLPPQSTQNHSHSETRGRPAYILPGPSSLPPCPDLPGRKSTSW